MRFCKECDNMLYPFEHKVDGKKEGKLAFKCKICAFQEVIEQTEEDLNCVYKSDQTRNQQKVAYQEYYVKDPTLSRTIRVTCDKCKSKEAVTFCNPTKDKMQLYYACLNCKHYWLKVKPDEEEDYPSDSDWLLIA